LKTTRKATLNRFLISLMLLVMIFGSPQSAFGKVNRVAIVPFKVNAEKDLSFLRDGIVDMLTSRLYVEDKVSVLCREEIAKVLKTVSPPINESKAREIGSRLGVDYVLFGSLTVFGESVSIDAKMVDVSGAKPVLTFFNQSQGMDEVIPKIDLFATDINEKVFGRAMPARKVIVTSQIPQTQTPEDQTDVRIHPEKLFAGGFQDVDTQETQRPAPGLAFLASQAARSKSAQFWRSRSIKHRINGIAIGDIDSDGKQETVIITEHAVEVYRFEKKRFFKVKTIAERHLDNLIGVDVADINANGYPEIFVSSLNPHRTMVNSFVLEFNGQTYTEIVTNSRWYFRVVDHLERGQILLGQRQKTSSPFTGQIYEMIWENSGYVSADKVMHPRRTNVMGFALGNARNDDTEVIVTYNDLDYLRISTQSGKERWKDKEHSGRRMEYFVTSDLTSEFQEKDYYPMRIVIMDITGDGKNEVITIKNHTLSELISYRTLTQGEIEVRSWDEIGLAVHWRTRKLTGYFSDFAIGDFDNDGNDELVAALVIKTGSVVLTDAKSKVIAYELQ